MVVIFVLCQLIPVIRPVILARDQRLPLCGTCCVDYVGVFLVLCLIYLCVDCAVDQAGGDGQLRPYTAQGKPETPLSFPVPCQHTQLCTFAGQVI